MSDPGTTQIDPAKLEAFLHRVVGDCGSAFGTTLAFIGDRLGLYRAMAESGPITPAELAERTGTHERYVREWLLNQAAGGYAEYDADTGRYTLPPEHALALTDEASPFFVGGMFQIVTAVLRAEPRIREGFRTGEGMLWGEHHHDLFEGTER
ncbi:MAG TPA: SAM-dependent methyltransferase, partial [Armatimonadota bacterium]|nr:SAM-dependent methyltransferase [Armatimonadota bacterium]